MWVPESEARLNNPKSVAVSSRQQKKSIATNCCRAKKTLKNSKCESVHLPPHRQNVKSRYFPSVWSLALWHRIRANRRRNSKKHSLINSYSSVLQPYLNSSVHFAQFSVDPNNIPYMTRSCINPSPRYVARRKRQFTGWFFFPSKFGKWSHRCREGSCVSLKALPSPRRHPPAGYCPAEIRRGKQLRTQLHCFVFPRKYLQDGWLRCAETHWCSPLCSLCVLCSFFFFFLFDLSCSLAGVCDAVEIVHSTYSYTRWMRSIDARLAAAGHFRPALSVMLTPASPTMPLSTIQAFFQLYSSSSKRFCYLFISGKVG